MRLPPTTTTKERNKKEPASDAGCENGEENVSTTSNENANAAAVNLEFKIKANVDGVMDRLR